jgi:hypothetical protein
MKEDKPSFRDIEASVAVQIASGELVGKTDPVTGVRYFTNPAGPGHEYLAAKYRADNAEQRGVEVHERIEQYLKDNPVQTLQGQMLDAAMQLLATKANQARVTFDGLAGRDGVVTMTRDEARSLVNQHDRRPLDWDELLACKRASRGFGSHYLRQQLGWIAMQRDLKVRSGVHT